ncbi:DUF697 domain-containing protein [Synechococcales cyanobacterium C]|uniref:DUF697 domain-containing protein n=1 Tax=Petrachloros mirabilis ULC683 TaxID=2781853 RepID=A0A8K2A7V8_9CYAN|nr:GTP-binding protein [Petrachloros mirabilis]NCJ07324.1 DUF697 domain-containing protein [Petrachloros mirabilis ULC683]
MGTSRLLILLVGLAIILGLVLWLVSALQGFYGQITSPWLANLVLALIIGLLIVLIGAFIYYLWQFRRRPRRAKVEPQVPVAKTDAATQTLAAVRRQVAQIQDEMTRQALLERSRDIEAGFARQTFKIVVFGTGSAGKTSLVNALIGRMAGAVGATLGTTTVGQTYSFQLRGIDRDLWITDTPGLLEPGVAGTEREQAARKLATEADLLLFVVDQDLTQSEYRPLSTLGHIGKRSLLVLNKIDRYRPEDREAILGQLRERVRSWMTPEDVVAIAAHPQPVILPSKETLQPDPDLQNLLRRMSRVLRVEGDDLMADNILLQSQRLGEEVRELLDQQRRRQADQVVDRFQWIGAGVIWVTPIPVVDLLATAAVNAQMVVEIAQVYGCELNLERGRELAVSLAKTLGSLGIVKGVLEIVSRALQFSVAGYVVGKTVQAISAAYLIRIAGKSFIEYFRNDQDWGDGGITEVVQHQFQLNRRDEFVKAFIQDAITKLPESLGLALRQKAEAPEPQGDDWE